MTEPETMTKAELLAQIEQGWNEFNAYLQTLTEEQLTQRTDAAGWTVKDHLIHIAFWEDSILAMLNRQSYRAFLKVDEATFQSDDVDRINAVIRWRYQAMSPQEVLNMLREVHQRAFKKIRAASDDDLNRPCRDFQPDIPRDEPVKVWVLDNTFGHYQEHTPWIAAIVAQGSRS